MVALQTLYRKLNRKMTAMQKKAFARSLRKETGNHSIRINDEPSVAAKKANDSLHARSRKATKRRRTSSTRATTTMQSARYSRRVRQRRRSNSSGNLLNLIAMALFVAGCSQLIPKGVSSKLGSQGSAGRCKYKIELFNNRIPPSNIKKKLDDFITGYYQRQEASMCMKHALNNLLHGAYADKQEIVTKNNLDSISSTNNLQHNGAGDYELSTALLFLTENNILYTPYTENNQQPNEIMCGIFIHYQGHYNCVKKFDDWFVFIDSLAKPFVILHQSDLNNFLKIKYPQNFPIRGQNAGRMFCI
jgi:hypothetical protein